MSLLKKTDRFDIYLEEGRHIILIRLKWKYNWFTTTTPWTLHQKQRYHNLVDNLIWKKWGGTYIVKVKGPSDFAKKYSSQSFTINFDVQWVLNSEHWNVNVTKTKPGINPDTYVDWNPRVIVLDTEDVKFLYTETVYGVAFFQVGVEHEFGHAIGNSRYALQGSTSVHGDEYKPEYFNNGGFQWDLNSIMNIGNQLRTRHLDYVLKELNSLYPNTQFYL